jgi:hypothetical protein
MRQDVSGKFSGKLELEGILYIPHSFGIMLDVRGKV